MELEKGIDPDSSLRSPLCAMTLLTYHTIVAFFTGKLLQFSQRKEHMVFVSKNLE